ncbi:hypothetical protein EMCRGX_G025319 [Ephydatia muelleri]
MKNLTYALALEEAEMAERVARDAAQFHESGTTVEVHQVPKKTEFKKTERCYRCEGNTILKRVGLSRKNADIVTKLGISNELVERNRETTDSGCCLTRQFKHIPLKMTMARLKTYSGEPLFLRGQILVRVKKGRTQVQLLLLVVESQGPPLMGRNRLSKVSINWYHIKELTVSKAQEKTGQQWIKVLLRKHPGLFREELGRMSNIAARLMVKEDTSPVFLKARPVPYSLRQKVEMELERMVSTGALSPVSWSEWAAPIVVVPKSDGSVRICGDFRVSINPFLKVDQYLLPRVEDILEDSTIFSKIDRQSAYLQMELEEESKEFTTINTHKGLYRFNRLAFGIASAIWQRAMEQVLVGIQCLLDDIIVARTSMEEHFMLLEQVLERLAQ